MALSEKALLQIFVDISFADRFYDLYETTRSRMGADEIAPEAVAEVLEDLGFDYAKSGRFYRRSKRQGGCKIDFHVSVRSIAVELILVVKAGDAVVGGPFAGIAEDVKLLDDPDFAYSPPYPKPLFSSRQELEEIMAFGCQIYDEVQLRLFAPDDGVTA
jgi:hypothetical protein